MPRTTLIPALPSDDEASLAKETSQPKEMARGDAMARIPVQAELTPQQAADMLAISRIALMELLQQREIPLRKGGHHKRIRFNDLMAFKRNRDLARRNTLKELTAYDQELKL